MSREIPSGDSIVQGRNLDRGFDETFDAIVVGSGAGGSPVAAYLAEAGWRVLILEEGPYYRPEEYGSFRASEILRRMWREAGMFAAFGVGNTPVIGLAAGRCVGGSSVLTGGVCFRIPGVVHDEWVRERGLTELSEGAFEQVYQEVERRVHVDEVPADMRAWPTRRLVAGAESLGIRMRPTRRNTVGCEGNARCNFGCPAQAKQSVDVTFLPSALEHGARLVSDALVQRVLIENGRAVGVQGRLLDPSTGKTSHKFVARAPIVVAACGTLHTPLLLMRSGLGRTSDALGSNVTLHPAVRMSAQFDEPLDGFSGSLQAVYSDHFASEGITIVGLHSPPNVLAAALPGIGAAHREIVRKMRGLSAMGGMVHDRGGGRVRPGPGREPILWYRMSPRDLQRLRRTITILGEIAFAAGARALYPPVFGVRSIQSVGELRRLEHEPIDARRIECIAFHPLGSARMSVSASEGVVSPTGETHEVQGLFVADGSVLPTSIGVNSQVPVMSMATRIGWIIRDRFKPRSLPARSRLARLLDNARWHLPI
ncbi:MAG: GMC family oxidoreductase [Deltaproteobacteria bacterium]|nr:GMC family oxidoreductase [Deltaproteobacteria bacterium]